MFRRWVFYIIAAISSLLCLATLVLWDRSYRTYDSVSQASGNSRYEVASAEGTCAIREIPNRRWPNMLGGILPTSPAWVRDATPAVRYPVSDYVYWFSPYESWSIELGFHFNSQAWGYQLNIPHWFISLIFALIAAGLIVLNNVGRLAAVSGESRRKIRRAVRLLSIGIATVGVVIPLAVLVFGYNAREGWAAVWGTPAIYLLFITVPVAGIALASGTLRAQKLRLWKWYHRHSCSQCGYNLKGNVSGVCPECGMVLRARS